MSTQRPGLTDATGHAEYFESTTQFITTDQFEIEKQNLKDTIVTEVGELTLPSTTNVVNTFNGITGDIVFVVVDGGEI